MKPVQDSGTGRVRPRLGRAVARLVASRFAPVPMRPDGFGKGLWLALGVMTAATGILYWVLNTYWETNWLAAEDGLSEWATVVMYLMGVLLAARVSLSVRRSRHHRMSLLYGAFAVVLVIAVLEEISWGQRMFGWTTPESLAEVNFQDETTVHNIQGFDVVSSGAFALVSLLGLVGICLRVLLHRQGVVTTLDLWLPPVALTPPLLLITLLFGVGEPFRRLMEQAGLRPVGGETAEVLSAICVVVFLVASLRIARALKSPGRPRETRP